MFESKKKGFRMEDAAKQYGVGLSTVYKIVQNGEKVFGSPLRDSAKTQRKASELHLQLKKRLIQWIISTEKSGVMVDGHFLKARAAAIADELKISDLKFSNGWLGKFKARHDMKFKKACGEKKKVLTTRRRPLTSGSDKNGQKSKHSTSWKTFTMQMKLDCFTEVS